jgi:predicted dehydrogenase
MLDRRAFLAAGAATSLAASRVNRTQAAHRSSHEPPSQRVVVGVMGLSRGLGLAEEFSKVDGVEIRYACDADSGRAQSGGRRIAEMGQQVESLTDFRRILDDPDVDVLICAAPNHWHGPATILACQAGKHVYVEKPASHNPQEGEWMVQAAERYGRVVQVGNQRRSSTSMQEAMAKLHSGIIGQVYLSRAFFTRMRGSIGTATPSDPPDGLDYDLWQGPAPRQPYRSNVVHYNWHWFWHWGNGELGNNGVHNLDICRWGLGVDFPTEVTSLGGRYCHNDDQETPDTHAVAFKFGDRCQLHYEGLSGTKTGNGPFVSFFGTEGYMEVDGNGGYRVLDLDNKEIERVAGTGWGQTEHVQNFVAAVRAGDASLLNNPITEGHRSTLLCHLGNIAYRTGRTVRCRPEDGHIVDDADQQALWRRQYDPAWEAQVTHLER